MELIFLFISCWNNTYEMGIIAGFAMWNFIDSIDMALCHSELHQNEISVKNQFQWINIAVVWINETTRNVLSAWSWKCPLAKILRFF